VGRAHRVSNCRCYRCLFSTPGSRPHVSPGRPLVRNGGTHDSFIGSRRGVFRAWRIGAASVSPHPGTRWILMTRGRANARLFRFDESRVSARLSWSVTPRPGLPRPARGAPRSCSSGQQVPTRTSLCYRCQRGSNGFEIISIAWSRVSVEDCASLVASIQ